MKRVWILLATGLVLLGGSAVRAADDDGAPGTTKLAPVPAAPAESCGAGGACGDSACAGHGGKHSGRFCAWLCYRPPQVRCACGHQVATCTPPLYTFFLDMCQARGCGGCAGCGHAAVPQAPCAGGGCAAHP